MQHFSLNKMYKMYTQLMQYIYPIFIYIWMKHMLRRFVAFSQHWLFTEDQKQQEKNMLGETYIRSIAYESWLMRSAHLFRFKIITYVKVTRLWCLTNSFHQKNASQWMFFPLTASTVWGLLSWHEVKWTVSWYGIHILHAKMDCSTV